MKTIILSLFLVFFTVFNTNAQTKKFKNTVKTLMELNGTEETFSLVLEQMMTNFRDLLPDVPDRLWRELELEISKTSLDDLVDLYAPIYAKHLTQEEMNDIVAFYKSPTGKKFGTITPKITEDAMSAGEKWGRKIGERILKRLKEEGYN